MGPGLPVPSGVGIRVARIGIVFIRYVAKNIQKATKRSRQTITPLLNTVNVDLAIRLLQDRPPSDAKKEGRSAHISCVNADRAQHMYIMETLPGQIANFNSDI